jgi:CheY-like chemotaxis protein
MTFPSPDPMTVLAERLVRQLEGLERWHAVRAARLADLDLRLSASSRDERLVAGRQRDALERAHAVVEEQAGEQLRTGLQPSAGASTLLVAHPQPWTAERLSARLGDLGMCVIAQDGNGADALGRLVAEQPDVLVVNDVLSMLSGVQLIEEARLLAPATRVVALVSGSAGFALAQEAGAHAVVPYGGVEAVARCVRDSLELEDGVPARG